MTTGEQIRNYREAAGLTQSELAARIGTTPQNISQYERGLRNPKLETVQRIAGALGLDASLLLDPDSAAALRETASSHIPATFPARLTARMAELQLRQVDLLEKISRCCNIKVSKSHLSQYVAGKVTPGSEKLYALSLALEVNECWLLGYDVPPTRNDNTAHSIRYAVFGAPCTDAQFQEVCRFARWILWRDSQK